jgi:hypothetical protein
MGIGYCMMFLHHQSSWKCKNRLELWAKVDVAKDTDMHTKMKQLGVKMQKQIVVVLRLFHDFTTNCMF